MNTMKMVLSVLVIISYMLVIATAISDNTSNEIYAPKQITSTNQTIAESFDSTDETSIHQKIEDPCAKFTLAPLNPKFLEYQNRTVHKNVPLCVGMTADDHTLGLIPHPVDLSHLGNVNAALTYLGYSDSYDLRSLGRVTSVKDQGTGDCWAHATYASLESYLLPAETWDFSENNMKNLLSSLYPEGFDRLHSDGGNHLMSTAYLARWNGPINESDDPYNATNGVSPSGLNATKHVQNVLFIPDRDNFSDNDNIKWAIVNYGAVYSTMYHDDSYYNSTNYTYYYSGSDDGNHAIAIVGWNDSFDKNKFPSIPSGNGAFITKNSWGTDFGENGYFYISYYDSVIGIDNAIFTAEELNNYDYVYQHDPLGWSTSYGDGDDTAWAANIFTAQTDESLEAVSFYTTDSNVEYKLYIYTDPISGPINTTGPMGTKTGTISLAGYHTIPLDSNISINTGQNFSVVVKFTNPTFLYPIAIESSDAYYYSSKATANAEEGYCSSDGTTWTDITTTFENTSICIKAFTTKDYTPPSASGEMPLNGLLISSATPLISVNITDNASGVNVSSIVMSVNDSIVEISNISITEGYMVYNQTSTPFADNQLINVSVGASDNSSNSMTYNWSFTIDTTPPIIYSATANPSEIEANGTDNTLLNVTATDLRGIASVSVNLSAIGGSQAQAMSNNSGVWQFTTNTTNVGTFELPVNVTDNAGNSNTSVNILLNAVDNTPPVITGADANPSTIEANGTDDTLLNVTATDLRGIASVSVNLSAIGGPQAQAMSNNSGVWQFTTNTTTVGTFELPVNATDNAGNSNTSVNITLYVNDTTAPTLSNHTPATGTTNLKPTISINAIDIGSGINVSSANMTVNGTEVLLANTNSAFTYNFSNITTTPYSHGDKVNVTFSVSDKQGHTSNESWSFYIDNVTPTISITLPAGGYSTTASSINVSGAVNGTGSPPVVTVNGINATLSSLKNFSGTFTAASVPISLGTNTIYANVTDAAGNISSTSISVTRTSPSTPSSSSGGGGGGSSGEAYENIEFKDVSRVYISSNADISFAFDEPENDIQYVNYRALTSAGYISTVVEMLKDISTLAKEAAPDISYKNINIWVGKSGYATEANIENPVIGFKVEKKWIQDNDIEVSSIKLNRYHGDTWTALSTAKTDEDSTHLYFESQTPGFSPFAITGQKKTLIAPTPIVPPEESIEEPAPATTPDVEVPPEPTSWWKYLLTGAVILLIIAGAYLYLRKQQS